jgi:serine/threonine protein kinase/Flp pilus assembly protein TadD
VRPDSSSPRESTAWLLPSAEQDRLASILDDYLTALENGAPISPEELLTRYPDDAEKLRGYLSGLELFHQAATAPEKANGEREQSGAAKSPRVIGDFRLVREIGRGGMGVVYEAWQMSLRRLVALKILPFAAAHDAKQLSRFRNEAQAAAQVQHPNIVPVYAVGEEGGIPFYAMQLIPGQCLAKVLNELRSSATGVAATTVAKGGSTVDDARMETVGDFRPLPIPLRHAPINAADTADHIRAVARLGVQAAEALHAAHEYGVVHRDVKPSNLLVDDQGQLWVTDFGLARCCENDGLTQTGDVVGTMRYMSPEQALGRTTLVDHRTDIYSLGVTVYELATLVHPADCVSGLQPYFDRNRPNIKPLRHWNSQIPLDFQTIVMKAMSEFPSERYRTARELANDLERFLAGKPILATPPNAATRIRKWARRHRRVLAAAVVAAFVGLFAHTLLLTQERAEREAALARANQSLDHAHAVLDRFASQLVDQLAAIPGAEGVRSQLLQDSLDLYRQFERQARHDASRTDELAVAYGKMGSLAEKMADHHQARELLAKARGIWETQLTEDPDNARYARNLAWCEKSLATITAATGPTSDAIELLQQARRRLEHAAAIEPDKYAIELAMTCSDLGQMLSRTGDTESAVQEFKDAIAVLERQARTSPENQRVLQGLSTSYDRLGAVLSASDPGAAAEAYRKSIPIQQKLVTADPINRLYQGNLARTYTDLGFVLCGREDWRHAEICYTNAAGIQENMVSASPFATAYRCDLAISYNNLGMAQSRDGRLRQAEASFRKAEQLQRRLLADQPTDPQLLSNQGSVLNNLGQLLDRLGQAADAESAYREAIELQKRACDAAPDNALLQDLLSRHRLNLTHNLQRQRKLKESMAIIRTVE